MTNSEMILHWYEQLWHRGNEAVIDELMHPQCVVHGLAPEPIVGPNQFREVYRVLRGHFPTVAIKVKRIFEKDDLFALLGKATFTDGDGNSFTMRGSLIARVENGQFIEAWDNWDFHGLLVQMGAVSPSAMADAIA